MEHHGARHGDDQGRHLGDGRVGRGDHQDVDPPGGLRQVVAPRASTPRTSHPASASAAASERPARPGPISRTVVTRPLSALQPLTEGAGRSRRSDQYPFSLPTTWTFPPAPSRTPGGTSSGASSASGSTTNRRSPHAGMGDHQVVVVDHGVTDEEHVDVQGAGPVAHSPLPSRRLLERAGPPRGARGARARCRARPRGSGKALARRSPHRLGLVDGATPPPRRGARAAPSRDGPRGRPDWSRGRRRRARLPALRARPGPARRHRHGDGGCAHPSRRPRAAPAGAACG